VKTAQAYGFEALFLKPAVPTYQMSKKAPAFREEGMSGSRGLLDERGKSRRGKSGMVNPLGFIQQIKSTIY